MTNKYIQHADCFDFVSSLEDGSVHLAAFDPPFFGIVEDSWDNQWKTVDEYVDWMLRLLSKLRYKLTPDGSVVFFGGIGKHGHRPLFKLMEEIEEQRWLDPKPGKVSSLLYYRNMITWSKRRGYGKEFDYLFCREEICWYSVSEERTKVVFNIPLTDTKRGYAGFNAKYPAKSEYKRVTNVWTDIPELMRPERNTQKPLPLMERIIKTHSNEGDLVVDMFCGWGTTGIAAVKLGRRFLGCEKIEADADAANQRCLDAVALGLEHVLEQAK